MSIIFLILPGQVNAYFPWKEAEFYLLSLQIFNMLFMTCTKKKNPNHKQKIPNSPLCVILIKYFFKKKVMCTVIEPLK